MDIDSNQITLTVVSVKLDSKKITNAVLDQIPRLDFCKLLVDENNCFDNSHTIVPVCRFSLVSLLNSQRRIYKAKGYASDHAGRLIDYFKYQDEGFLFTHAGQLYCDSFSSKTGTQEYGNQHEKLKNKLDEASSCLTSINKILDLESQGVTPNDIAKQCTNQSTYLPHRKSRKTNKTMFDDWNELVHDWDDDDETTASKELQAIINKYESWEKYIETMKNEALLDSRDKQLFENEVELYKDKVSAVIGNVLSSPFAMLGC